VAATPSIRIAKTHNYKGGSRTWSNRYHFTGGTPADATHWTTLSDAIVNAEKACFQSGHVIVESFGYAAGSDVPVFTKVYSTAGTLTPGANDRSTTLEASALVRWSTAARSTKNHPIYCFSYIHGALFDSTVAYNEKLASGQKSALATYATDWVSGFSDGANTYVRATPTGHTAIGSVVEEYITHRDFPYTTSL